MADIQVGIQIKVNGDGQASASLTNLSGKVAQTGAAANAARGDVAAYGQEWANASARLEAAGNKLKNASGTFMAAQLSKQLRPMATELAAVEAQSIKTARGFESLAVGLAKSHMLLMGARQTLAMAQGLTQTADAAAQLEARLKLVSGTTLEYAAALKTVSTIADTYQQDLGTLGQTYQQLAPAVQKLGMSQQDLGDILAAMSAGLKLSGTSAGQSGDLLRQFAQALNSATVQAEPGRVRTAHRTGHAPPPVRGAYPCILFSVMVSCHHLRRSELERTLKDQPCRVDQALCLTSHASPDTER